jgi:hypothetical protein
LAPKKISEGSGFHQQIREITKQLVLFFLFAVVSSSFDLHPRVEKSPLRGRSQVLTRAMAIANVPDITDILISRIAHCSRQFQNPWLKYPILFQIS